MIFSKQSVIGTVKTTQKAGQMAESIIFKPQGGSNTQLTPDSDGNITISQSGAIVAADYYDGLPIPDSSSFTSANVIITNNAAVTAARAC